MSDQENMNQNEEEMDEEILINQEEGEGQDMYAFEVDINGESYIIIIGKTEENKLFLRLMDKEDQTKPFFQNEFSLDDLRKINPIFNGIDSEDLAFQYLASNLNDAEKDLKNTEDEKVNFIIIITDDEDKIEFDFPLIKTIDEGTGENEMMENEMEEEEMINEVNELHEVNEEPNGEMESGHKEKNLPLQIGEKENIETKKDIKNLDMNIVNPIEEKKSKKEKEDFMMDSLNKQNMEQNMNSMKEELLNIINTLNENFNNQIMKQSEAFNSMKDDIMKQNDIKINKMKEELNQKDNEIVQLKNTIGNLEQKLNEYDLIIKDINVNNENNKSLKSSKADNINNKTVNELKTNINEIKNLYEKDKKDKENNIKALSEKITNLENKLPKSKTKDNDSLKIVGLENELKALESKINDYEFDQLIENIAVLMEKQNDSKLYELINNLGSQMNEMNKKLNKKDSSDSKKGSKSDTELINKINNQDNTISKLQNKINKIQEEREKEKLNDTNTKYKLSDIVKLTNDLKHLYSKTDSLNALVIKLEKENKELKIKTNELMNKLSKASPQFAAQDLSSTNKAQTKKISNPKNNYYYTLENQNYNQDNQISSYNRTNPNLNNVNFTKDSINSVIVNFDDIIFIQNRIKAIHPKIKEVYFNLVYRASQDGDKASDFHKKCDAIGPNVILIKTRKGNIFGGFTFKNWEHLPRDIDVNRPNLGSASRDTNAFGFSVNNQKIYNNEKPNEFAIWCNRNFGPTFKNNLFQIFDSCMKKGGYCSIRTNSHFGGQMYDYEISGGESRFKVEELEVFEIRLQ